MHSAPPACVDLYWLPLGADGHSVRFNGRIFEAIAAARQRRPRGDLYHAALIVTLDGERYAIELAPAWGPGAQGRGVVCTGAVGSRYLGWTRLFRYELRCCPGGSIPDLHHAVGGPHRLSDDPAVARRLLDSIAALPTPVWGRDELNAGEMWNSNSVIGWLLARAGIATHPLGPPLHGRAPGWQAGIAVAAREAATAADRVDQPPRPVVLLGTEPLAAGRSPLGEHAGGDDRATGVGRGEAECRHRREPALGEGA